MADAPQTAPPDRPVKGPEVQQGPSRAGGGSTEVPPPPPKSSATAATMPSHVGGGQSAHGSQATAASPEPSRAGDGLSDTAAVSTADERLCATCWLAGHSYKKCDNKCVYCGKLHARGICPRYPQMYPDVPVNRADEEAMLDRLRAAVREKEDEASRVEGESGMLKKLADAYDPPAPVPETAPKPTAPPASDGDKLPNARELLGEWSIWVPGFNDMLGPHKNRIQRRLNGQAKGHLPVYEESMLIKRFRELDIEVPSYVQLRQGSAPEGE